MDKYGFGVDVGGTTIKMGLFREDGELLEKWEIITDKSSNGKNILPDIADSIKSKMSHMGLTAKQCIGIGLDVPGPVTQEGIVLGCVNLGWGVGEINAAEELSKLCNMPVKVGNDANVAALGEMWRGGGKGTSDMIMVTLGTGVGAGIISNGRIVSGANGAAGELGHITVNPDEHDECNCGQNGCLEQYCSAPGIVRMARKKLQNNTDETSLQDDSELTARIIFDKAKAGDKVALEVVEEVGRLLGNALSNICVVTNPEVIVIGGGVSNSGKILTDAIEKYYRSSCFHACKGTRIELARLGNDAGIYGAMRQLLD